MTFSGYAISLRPVARILRRGVTWMSDVCVYMYKHERLKEVSGGGWGHAPPGNFLKLCSEIASEAILGQNQRRSSMARGVYCIQFLSVHVCIYHAS